MFRNVEPLRFLGRLLAWFVGLFALWLVVGPWYTSVLAVLTEPVVSIVDRPSDIWSVGTTIQFWPRGYAIPSQPPRIAAEWIQANTILLTALMLATPAATWKQKFRRLAFAFVLVLAWQVLDVCLAVEYGYATQIDPRSYTERTRYTLALATNLAMYLDTQVVPFMIWAGIHFRQLLTLARTSRTAGEALEKRSGKTAR